MIEITIFKEPITLGQFLKFSGLISTGGEVKNFLEESTIFVNNITENRRGKKLETAAKDFQNKMEKGLMTRSVAEEKAQKLQQQEAEFNNYAAQKQQEMAEEQMVMMNQIGDAIKTYLDKFNEEKKFAMILTSQGGTPVITADPSLNITEAVIAGLNAEYVASKNQNNE